jgi:hypothetical protein
MLPLAVLGLALLHAFGEIIYKKGGMQALSVAGKARRIGFWTKLLTSRLVILSLLISAVTKLLYGIVLASNPLYITGGLYLASVALFSVIGGKLVFSEKITRRQILGFGLIAVGMVLLV